MSVIKTGSMAQHIFIAGRTGSGKSELVQKYLSGYYNVICLDTKGTVDWNKIIPDIKIYTHLMDLIKNHQIGKAIYRPCWEELNPHYYNKFFEYIYLRQNTHVWIDEVMSICKGNDIPDFYMACLTRGRTLGINCWSVTQRPKTIPLIILSESSHFYIFDLNLEADKKRIQEIIPFKEIEEIPSKVGGEFSFWYYNFKMEHPIISKINL